MSGPKRTEDDDEGIGLNDDETQTQHVEDRGEVIFKNGAVYKGQWLG